MKHVLEGDEPREQKRLCTSSENDNFSWKSEKDSFRESSLSEKFIEIERILAANLLELSYSHPVTHVYNPIEYAFPIHWMFVNKFCGTKKKIMLLGMNPGPWGMSQTGVPFGEVNIVKEWIGITGEVGRPKEENPARPVLGFACKRSEISGQRFWGLFKDLCGEAKCFFEHILVYNHCPIAFMSKTGKNITPNELKVEERKALTILCDKALCDVIALFHISVIIAIGRFAENRATAVLKGAPLNNVKVVYIPHPSPRSFGNAEKWKEIVTAELEKNALMQYFKRSDNMNMATSEILPSSSLEHGIGQTGDSFVT